MLPKREAFFVPTAILQGQYAAAKDINRIQLATYFAIGKYISENSRQGFWGKGAIETISEQLKKELPGLRGFSVTSMKSMRKFYEHWDILDSGQSNSAIAIAELQSNLGQLAAYLRILDDKVRKSHENQTIGIILCKSANKEYVEYIIQDYNKPMGVATYTTQAEMPEKLRSALPSIDDLKKLL